MVMFGKLWGSLLSLGSCLNEGTRAHARWELRVSNMILFRRRRLLLLVMFPLLVVMSMEAARAVLPETIGGRTAYLPSFITPAMFWGSIIVGFLAGLITGVIGAGGGYILTPALMSFGIKGIMAVGTDQFHLFAKAIMATTIHRKLGNVNLWLAAWFVVGSVAGVSLGAHINRSLYRGNPALSDAFICIVYVVILGLLGIYALADWLRLGRAASPGRRQEYATTRFAVRMQSLRLPPYVRFDDGLVAGGRRISVYPVILSGFVVGACAAVIGVGGGFLTFPMFVYGLGVSTFTTVGTDVLQIIFTTCYSSVFQYAIYGFIFYTVAMGMLLGSLVGVQIGAFVTMFVKGITIRAFYALTILAGFFNRLAALPQRLSEAGYLTLDKSTGQFIERLGVVLFFALVGAFGICILSTFARNLHKARAAT
jgi:hypothetical protein